MEENKLRSSNLELFRIIAMILIVAHHYVVNSGLLNCITSDVTSAKSLFLLIFGWAGKTGINCFVLITGYFMCTSKITLRKGLKLLLEVELYNILIFIIFLATSYVDFSFKLMLKSILPITSLKTGFVSCYLVFFCFIPFLNILIHAMNQKQHITLTSLCLCIFSIFPCLHIKSRAKKCWNYNAQHYLKCLSKAIDALCRCSRELTKHQMQRLLLCL